MTSLLDGIKLPRMMVGVSLGEGGVLLAGFSHPAGSEEDVEPPDLETPIYIFRDEQGRITAPETPDMERALRELGL